MGNPFPDRQNTVWALVAVVAIAAGSVALGYVRQAESVVQRSLPALNRSVGDSGAASNPIGMRPTGVATLKDPFAAARLAPSPRRTTAASAARRAPSPSWVVSSILFKGSTGSAIVNDAWVSVGDRVAGGGRIASIERNRVVLTDATGLRHVLLLKEGEP